jgi:thiol-disulfide isomerase/thioredoxin
MRRHLQWSVLVIVAAVLLFPMNTHAGEKDKKEDKAPVIGKEPKVIAGELSADDPIDKKTKHPSKTHKVVLAEGVVYRIDMRSNDVDSFLRLENADGKELAFDDDSGGFPHARILQKIDKAGEYRIIATCFDDKTGKYTLTIREANAREVLTAKIQVLPKLPAQQRQRVLAEIKKELTQEPGKIDGELANTLLGLAINMEFGGKRDLALEMYADFGKILAAGDDPDVVKIGKMMQGAVRRSKLVGAPIVVHGQTLEGKDFNWKSYKGKVVLVDFWATWCGPCRAEIPNMKKMYEKYHDKGFEVVAISIDNGKDAPVKYMENEKLPWVCLFDPQPGKDLQPLAEYYGIFSIPQAILVDQEGRVVSMNARGAELERLLEKHIGPSEKSEKDGK